MDPSSFLSSFYMATKVKLSYTKKKKKNKGEFLLQKFVYSLKTLDKLYSPKELLVDVKNDLSRNSCFFFFFKVLVRLDNIENRPK